MNSCKDNAWGQCTPACGRAIAAHRRITRTLSTGKTVATRATAPGCYVTEPDLTPEEWREYDAFLATVAGAELKP